MSFDSWIGILGALAGLIGIGVAVYAFVKTKQTTALSYAVQSTELLGGNRNVLPGEVDVIFDGEQISNSFKLNYGFWNTGNTPIVRRQHLPEDMPITVQFDEIPC